MAKYLDYEGLEYYTDYVKGKLDGKAASSHTHSAADITSGTLAVGRGGTGATTAADARTNLGITPANIGAAESGHVHDSITDGSSKVMFAKTSDDMLGVSTIYFQSKAYGEDIVLGHTLPYYAQHRLLVATLLYGNESGTSGTVTLSEDVSSFTFLDIIFGNGEGRQSGVTRIYDPAEGCVAEVSCNLIADNGYKNLYFARYAIAGTTITPSLNNNRKSSLSGTPSVESGNVYVMAVVGYR